MYKNIIQAFKNREIKAKKILTIAEISKSQAYNFIRKYHYLEDAKFFSKFSYGLFISEELVGCTTYSNPQGISAMKSWFGLPNNDQSVLELSRLCLHPDLNGSNATSYLLSNSIKKLKRHDIRCVITLADSSLHVGSIYQVCNFKYYGLTNKKTDFYTADGRVNPRGTTKDVRGVWLPRTRKHRYAYTLDKNLKILLEENKEKPFKNQINSYICCKGARVVFDKRFNEFYDCPKCKTNK
jgi:hypothetical protein